MLTVDTEDKTEVGWPHWVTGRPPWLADGPVGPTASSLPRGGSSLVAYVGSRWISCRRPAEPPWFPPIYMRGGANGDAHHTSPQFSSSSSFGAWELIRGTLGVLGVSENRERVRRSRGEVLGLSALFSACTSMDAYSAVIVRDFLIYN